MIFMTTTGRDVHLTISIDSNGLQAMITMIIPSLNRTVTHQMPTVGHSLAYEVLSYERSGLPATIKDAEALIRAGGGVIPVTREIAAAVNAWVTEAMIANPCVRMERLVAERSRLYKERAAELDRLGVAREHSYEADEKPPSYNSPKVQALTAKIEAWESGHQDVMTEIACRRDKQIAAHMWD